MKATHGASVAQAEATKDIRAHTKALALSNFIACTTKEEVAHDETCAIERTGTQKASFDTAERGADG
jgi:hypothetical protein